MNTKQLRAVDAMKAAIKLCNVLAADGGEAYEMAAMAKENLESVGVHLGFCKDALQTTKAQSGKANPFQEHLDTCAACRGNPFSLCPEGTRQLKAYLGFCKDALQTVARGLKAPV